MIKNTKFAFFFIASLFSCCMLSCSSSDSDGETPNPPKEISEKPEDNLPEETRAFVGLWKIQSNKGADFLFFGDGICWMMPIVSYGTHTYYHDDGYWTYDTSTKILATTTEQWQWQVTLSNSEAWAGLAFDNNKTSQNFQKADNLEYMKVIISNSSWEESSDSTLLISGLNYFANYSGKSFYGHDLGGTIYRRWSEIEIVEDNNTNDYVFRYNLYDYEYKDRYKQLGQGTVTLTNPTSSSKQSLIFTGTINKTMHRSVKK